MATRIGNLSNAKFPGPEPTAEPKLPGQVKSKSKPKPVPTPTSLDQLKKVGGTLMAIPNDPVTGESLQGTAKDPNRYFGKYKGVDWLWYKGKATKD